MSAGDRHSPAGSSGASSGLVPRRPGSGWASWSCCWSACCGREPAGSPGRSLTSYDSRHPENAGVIAGLWGSFWLVSLATLLTVPIGVGAAIFLEEYQTKGWLADADRGQPVESRRRPLDRLRNSGNGRLRQDVRRLPTATPSCWSSRSASRRSRLPLALRTHRAIGSHDAGAADACRS